MPQLSAVGPREMLAQFRIVRSGLEPLSEALANFFLYHEAVGSDRWISLEGKKAHVPMPRPAPETGGCVVWDRPEPQHGTYILQDLLMRSQDRASALMSPGIY